MGNKGERRPRIRNGNDGTIRWESFRRGFLTQERSGSAPDSILEESVTVMGNPPNGNEERSWRTATGILADFQNRHLGVTLYARIR